jgi:ribosomal-protein-alanine N-acetyltransferase
VTRISDAPRLVPAIAADLPVMQNLGRFYVYEMARTCHAIAGYSCPPDGLWECMDFGPYFREACFHPFLLRSGEEPAGFAVVRDMDGDMRGAWNMEQFFVTAPHQRGGHGRRIFRELLGRFPGAWRIEVLPQNSVGLAFWRSVAAEADSTVNETREIVEDGDYDPVECVVLTLSAP